MSLSTIFFIIAVGLMLLAWAVQRDMSNNALACVIIILALSIISSIEEAKESDQ